MIFHRKTELRHSLVAVVPRLRHACTSPSLEGYTIRPFGKAILASFLLASFLLDLACSPGAPPVAPADVQVPRLSDEGRTRETVDASARVHFRRTTPVVGTRWRVAVQARSAVAVPDPSTSGATHVQISEYDSLYSLEVVATEGPAITRVRIAFETNEQRYQGAPKPTAVAGKTYVVDASAVRDPAGAPVTEEEAQRVFDMVPDLGTRAQIDQILPERPMALQEERHELAGAVLRVIHPRAWTLEKGSAVLASASADEAVFDVELEATSSSRLRLAVRGKAHVRLADSRLVRLDFTGTYDHPPGAASPTEPGNFTLHRVVSDL